jgi:uncharacterized protein (TIGR02147 family)
VSKPGPRFDPEQPDVFAYLDFRAYLRDYYEQRKASAALSYRGFSRRARLRSPNYLKLVIDGQRNLTAAMSQRFADACGLRGKAADFFLALVRFGQARNQEERAAYYQALRRFERYRQAHRLDGAQEAYHSTWYLPVIRELCGTRGFSEDPTWIARSLIPPIRPEQAESALALLLELRLLERDADGALRQGQGVVSTGADRVRSLHLRSFHRKMLELAASSLDRLPAPRRDISALTLRLGPDGIAKLKQRMQELRRELIDMAESEDETTQVVHVGLQVFPLSRAHGEDASNATGGNTP